MSLYRGLPDRFVGVYQSVFLARLVLFEPLYVSLQMLPNFQISIIFSVQLVMTGYTIVAVLFKGAFKNLVFGVLRIFIDSSILFFLTLGMYCQFTYGKIDPQEYFARFNLSWATVQKTCIYLILACCGVMIVTVIVQVFYGVKEAIAKNRLKKKISEEQDQPEPESTRKMVESISHIEQQQEGKTKFSIAKMGTVEENAGG